MSDKNETSGFVQNWAPNLEVKVKLLCHDEYIRDKTCTAFWDTLEQKTRQSEKTKTILENTFF